MDKKEPRTTRRFALSVLRFTLVAESEERTTNSTNRTNFGFREASWKLYLSVKSVKSVVSILNTDNTNKHRYCFLGRKRGEGKYVERVTLCVGRGGIKNRESGELSEC